MHDSWIPAFAGMTDNWGMNATVNPKNQVKTASLHSSRTNAPSLRLLPRTTRHYAQIFKINEDCIFHSYRRRVYTLFNVNGEDIWLNPALLAVW